MLLIFQEAEERKVQMDIDRQIREEEQERMRKQKEQERKEKEEKLAQLRKEREDRLKRRKGMGKIGYFCKAYQSPIYLFINSYTLKMNILLLRSYTRFSCSVILNSEIRSRLQ